jgi:hypothetical protein
MNSTIIPILAVFLAGLITIRYQEVSKKREKFDKEYSEFADAFLDFFKTLESSTANLNYSIITEYPIHIEARKRFIHNLKGSRLNSFNKKWGEYTEHYNTVNDLGPLGVTISIAPSNKELQNATHLDAPRWESDRKNKIHVLISDLLVISKIKIWL